MVAGQQEKGYWSLGAYCDLSFQSVRTKAWNRKVKYLLPQYCRLNTGNADVQRSSRSERENHVAALPDFLGSPKMKKKENGYL